MVQGRAKVLNPHTETVNDRGAGGKDQGCFKEIPAASQRQERDGGDEQTKIEQTTHKILSFKVLSVSVRTRAQDITQLLRENCSKILLRSYD